MYRKEYELLPDEKKIREEVFVTEQHFVQEFDEIDRSTNTAHLVFYDKEVPIAVCRYYPGEKVGEYIAGRIAIRKQYRGRHLGRRVMQILEENISADGGQKIILSAQARVQPFYEKLDYKVQGEIYYDEYCPHVRMEKVLVI